MIQKFIRLLRFHPNKKTAPETATRYLRRFTIAETKARLQWLQNRANKGV
ncbi:hypothetical protein Selin_1461 [Desulfurispirillum indicum S5]|uniref:Uncharacterized protein n=1 Tax=Desulfurispirillum indicum (strain ATCC BAA-1389 / DSM 22839 / S5) TaxID=653733 RepID=E6W6V2_DESIS|nr:hypothetical protein [Desulfurispirillum indicum]ADU66195.1 hypothetical protein Selin_1461 [Desulfurispirillum indicum S5]